MRPDGVPNRGPETVCFYPPESPKATSTYRKKQIIFQQGDPADDVFYVCQGRVKLGIISQQGKEAVIALLGPGDFFGEGCLAGQELRTTTASAISPCTLMRLDKAFVVQAFQDNPDFSAVFLSKVLGRSMRVEEDLVDQLFNSSEKRLARLLLRMANFGKEPNPAPVVLRISQQTLAQMIGTTRPRVNFFMNKFRREGQIDYHGGITVHPSLVNVILYE